MRESGPVPELLDKKNLLARLAEGHAARITVVTPNARLSQALMAEVDALQAGKGLASWEAPDILPFNAFVERLYEDASYTDAPTPKAPEAARSRELPLLLTPTQETWLWAEVIRASGRTLLSPERTAAQCRAAWQLAHAWRIAPGGGNEDAAAFAEWSRAYEKKTAGDVDAARLPDLVKGFLRELRIPRLLVAYAFDLLTPQARDFLAACEAAGVEVVECRPQAHNATPVRTSFPSARDELEAAARWARARLENRGQVQIFPRIGIVIPDLSLRRKEAVRIFSQVLDPGYNLPGAPRKPLPFNVSLGVPLDEVPLVQAALALLELCHGELPYEAASRLIRSPFLGAAEQGRSLRAALDARLRRDAPARIGLASLVARIDKAPRLRAAFEATIKVLREEKESLKPPSAWARHFSALLEAAGFPGERTLDSEEFQARAKWHETLGELARLDRVSASLPYSQALAQLKALCADTLFQPESGEAPIQVLGILESAGLEFDHLWVSGLTDEAWPLRARPNPFLPVAAQKKAGIPEASAEGAAALDARITEGWKGAAAEVVLSHYEKEDDRSLAPSPLIAGLARAELALPAYPRYRDLVFRQRALQSIADRNAPPLGQGRVRGGTRVLADQAACPFRAFARWRLRAETLETPAEGLDAAGRGTLLHALMFFLWQELKTSASLEKDVAPAIAHAAEAAVKELGLEGRFAELERARLARLAREWLDVERARTPFEVASMEEKRTLHVGPLELSARIDRIDRLVEGPMRGGQVVIDYKTSRAPSPKHWEPPRPDDPQVPIYAVSAAEDVAAVAFAKVRLGDMKFMGFSEKDGAVPGVKPAKAWAPLLASWRTEAARLAGTFAAGEAEVDPKRGLQTCRTCDLQTLCRVYEKLNVLEEGEPNGEGAGS